MFTGCAVPRRIPAPPPGKTLVWFDEIPDWVYTFTVPDDLDLEYATSAELRSAYQEWERRVKEWRATHETPGVAEAIAMPDGPWDVSVI